MTLRRSLVTMAAALAASLAGVTAPASATHDLRLTSGGEERVNSLPLAGRTVVIDPGHQLGNHNYPRRIARLVPAGGFQKPCNTTGTATNGGYAEATFAWQVSRVVKNRLQRLGATVRLTRHSNRQDRWGPCVDIRGRAGNRLPADLKVSIHGDGSWAAGARGFHVIAPTDRRPWTHDIYRPSRRAAVDTRAALRGVGLPVANYVAGGDGLDFRSDLATLNLSNVPTVMVELGNMRNPRDARRMRSKAGRATYARGLALGVRRFLG
jgi:N-acetylmuramoyl-L-alanine amidase